MRPFRLHLASLLMLILAGGASSTAAPSYYERFNEALAGGKRGFLTDISLLDTNNSGPILTKVPIRFSTFREKGELKRIRLGMGMSEVVRLWGKPQRIITRCIIGPRLYYGIYGNDVSLFFRGERLVLIGLADEEARQVVFDNGLSGRMGRAECERVLGVPNYKSKDPWGAFVGQMAYLTNGVRMDFAFDAAKERGSTNVVDRLFGIAVRLEKEAVNSLDEPDGPANGSQPTRSGTNSTPSTAGSRR